MPGCSSDAAADGGIADYGNGAQIVFRTDAAESFPISSSVADVLFSLSSQERLRLLLEAGKTQLLCANQYESESERFSYFRRLVDAGLLDAERVTDPDKMMGRPCDEAQVKLTSTDKGKEAQNFLGWLLVEGLEFKTAEN
ncbi:hypothetical protein B5C34_01115 [Pacificimonas flava]|uniref:Uncharacterized protein n=2 Tax=Pacificimonas TaxID=1960290 RepID=A0A219B1G5_9SPHN|nr:MULTISPECIES: hypothetical protein [Pacificimonas]MBZ6378185.1 hypothetical protein [Pacificimonas aurantium]OWV32187.1 hypothetical protein B5C34_01115 [Pacificimonas flava]